MSNHSELHNLNNQVESLLNNKDFNNPKIRANLRKAKIAIYSQSDLERQSEDYLSEAVRYSELNLLHTLASRNNVAVQTAINSVKFFYQNSLIPHKPKFHTMIVAVHLLFLLSTNKTQEFYTKLEAILAEQLKGDYIDYVLKLNDAIEEGNYRKVFSLRGKNPLPDYFGPFLERILQTIRIEIAKSAEKAYTELSMNEALNIFEFKTVDQLRSFVNTYHESLEEIQTNWIFKDNKVIFEKETEATIKFNSEENIKRALQYSLQLQRIA